MTFTHFLSTDYSESLYEVSGNDVVLARQIIRAILLITVNVIIHLLPAPCSLLPAPCSLLPAPCSLLP
ncbi:MAG: hypothetical protein QM578_00460, partial [Pantoea sp.]|uniref:hypothetical protein n=1 Tax=Pantoea sp. TaxID=69393 RepID=UPI0039E4BCA9